MGIGAMVVGLIFRQALGSRFLAYEVFAALPLAGGIAALRFGVCSAVSTCWPSFDLDDQERDQDLPALLCGLPFLALACGCLSVMAALLVSEAPVQPAVLQEARGKAFPVIGIGFIGGLLLSLLVPLVVSIARAISRKRSGPSRRSPAS
jgi:hypothetical protein